MAKKVSRVLLVVSIKLSFAVSQTIKKKTEHFKLTFKSSSSFKGKNISEGSNHIVKQNHIKPRGYLSFL